MGAKMMLLRRPALVLGVVTSELAYGSALAGDAIIKIELHDATSNDATQGMQMKLDHGAIKAGSVTFQVVNESKALMHELLVLQTDLPAPALPYDAKKDVFIESEVKSLGEVEELQPGKSGLLTLMLKPGSYLLTCNKPGHLHAGMWAKFTVMP
jgi:uncharacterized cupredoxin-like copper-binding protein